jgi:outer membrane protein TolC
MKRVLVLSLLASLLAGQNRVASAQAAADTSRLEFLLEEALRINPRIAEAREMWRAKEASVSSAGALDDPMLELMLDDKPVSGEGSGRRVISATQAIPFPGKRGLMTEEARSETEASREMARDVIRGVVTEVKVAYYGLFMLESQVATLYENRKALEDAIAATRARYEAGQTGQQDLLLIQVEASEIDAEIKLFEAEIEAARARLNLTIGRAADAPLGRPWADSLSPFDASLEELVASARTTRPSVLAKQREADAAEAARRFAHVNYRPDFSVSAGYMQMPDNVDEWKASVGITLPLWKGRKQDALARAADQRFEAARQGLEQERNLAGISVEEQYANVTSKRAVTRQYKQEIIPLAELAYRSARANYLSGQVTFLVLLEAVRKNIELKKTYYEYFANFEMNLAMLEEAVGRDLGTIQLDTDAALETDREETDQ